MTRYKFVPNDLARTRFNLNASEYIGSGVTSLLDDVLGEFERLVPAQDPLCGGKESGEITILGGQSIGTIFRLSYK